MRIKGNKYDKMRAALRAVVDYRGGPSAVRRGREGVGLTRLLWDLWWQASDNLRYDDSHPFFRAGMWDRIIPQDEGFDLYSEGHADRDVERALLSVAKELGVR